MFCKNPLPNNRILYRYILCAMFFECTRVYNRTFFFVFKKLHILLCDVKKKKKKWEKKLKIKYASFGVPFFFMENTTSNHDLIAAATAKAFGYLSLLYYKHGTYVYTPCPVCRVITIGICSVPFSIKSCKIVQRRRLSNTVPLDLHLSCPLFVRAFLVSRFCVCPVSPRSQNFNLPAAAVPLNVLYIVCGRTSDRKTIYAPHIASPVVHPVSPPMT